MTDFYDLFQGNPDAYGCDTPDGVVCKRGDAERAVATHLEGLASVGIYPMWNDMVHWGCTDIDTGSWDEAETMWKVLDRMGLHPWIEISRSKGYHVWSFASEWVDAKLVRRAFLYAHHVSTVIGRPVPPTEINPKAEVMADGKLGNFVRLPYVGSEADENGRRIMLDHNGSPVALGEFLGKVQRVDPSTYRDWAAKYAPPRIRSIDFGPASGEATEIAKRLNPLGRRIFEEGPLPGGKRSNTMAKLAIECAHSGLEPPEALVLISDLDDRLGKWGREAPRRSCVEWGYNNA